jgi:hypothetical protein
MPRQNSLRMVSGLTTALLVLSEACAIVAPVPVLIERLPTAPVPYSLNSGLITAETGVIRDARAWSDAWSRIHSNRRPTPTLPPIEFASQAVLIVALGRRPSGGFSIAISDVTRDGNALIVDVHRTEPGEGCIVTTGISSGVDIAIIPSYDLETIFRESTNVTQCGNMSN